MISMLRRFRPCSRAPFRKVRIRTRLPTVATVLAAQKSTRNVDVAIRMCSRTAATITMNVPSEVDFTMSMISSRRRDRRCDAYSLKEEKMTCHERRNSPKIRKLLTFTRMDKNSAREPEGELCETAIVARPKHTTIKQTSNSLREFNRI